MIPVPEQSALFMSRLSGGEVLYEDGYLFLRGEDWLMGIGYPLSRDGMSDSADRPEPERFAAAMDRVRSRYGLADCFAIAPALPAAWQSRVVERDTYYVLPADASIPPALRGPVRKAATRLRVDETREFTAGHRRLWGEFLSRTPLNARIRRLYAATEALLATDAHVRLLNAWDAEGHLVACLVLDYGLPDSVSYIIGAHSKQHPAPHASDLLFAEMLARAQAEGRRHLLLGLGVNDGIRRFKRKWGGVPARPYELAMWQEGTAESPHMDALLKAMLAAPADMSKRQIFATLPSQAPFAMLWRLEKNGKTSWIGGAAHFFCCSFERSLRHLFNRVDTVLFEGPLDPESLDEVARHGQHPEPDDPRVLPFLSEADIRGVERRVNGPCPRLARLVNASGPPLVDVRHRLAHTRPWYAFFSLWTGFLERSGWANSVDMDGWNLALDMGKSVLGMESLAEQIASLESAPLPRIVRFLQSWQRWPQFRNRNESAYLWGDMHNMMGTSAEFPTRTEAIIDVRDQRFRERMRPYVEQGGTAVFVGSAHMLNLRRMLAEDGFTVTRELPTWKHRLRAWWKRDSEVVLLPPHGADASPATPLAPPTPLVRARTSKHGASLLGSGENLSWIAAQASVPEHIPSYVRAVSQSHLRDCGGFAAWVSGPSLVLTAFDPEGASQSDSSPRTDYASRLDAAVDLALREPGIERLTVLATQRPSAAPANAAESRDSWWGLALPASPNQKVRNMISRGLRETSIAPEVWTAEHAALVDDYLRHRLLSPGTRSLFSRLPDYAASSGALLLSARTPSGTLAAFTLGEMSALDTAFYLFAFRHAQCPPGVPDALLAALACEAARRGHVRLNLGLGIDAGIGFFKHKWGAHELFPHVETSWTLT